MAAVAFVINMTVAYADGFRENIAMTSTDVNGQFYLGQDGLSPIRLNGSHGNCAIVDMVLGPATGTDTRTASIRVNGKLISDVVLQAANNGTVYNRQFQNNPLRLPSGATLLFTQTT